MKPYYTDNSCQIFHGDVLAVLRELPSESVQCCVTSPPYLTRRQIGVLFKHGHAHQKGTTLESCYRVQEGKSLAASCALLGTRMVASGIRGQQAECLRNCQSIQHHAKRNPVLARQTQYPDSHNERDSRNQTLGRGWRKESYVWKTRHSQSSLVRRTYASTSKNLCVGRLEKVGARSACPRQILPSMRIERETGDSSHRPILTVAVACDGHRECDFAL